MCIKYPEVRDSTLWAVFLKFVVDYMCVPLSFALPVHTSTASTAGYPKGWVAGMTDHFHMYHTVQSQPVWCVTCHPCTELNILSWSKTFQSAEDKAVGYCRPRTGHCSTFSARALERQAIGQISPILLQVPQFLPVQSGEKAK